MGFNSWVTHVLLSSAQEVNWGVGSTLGLGGRQSVFMSPSEIVELARGYGVAESQLSALSESSERDHDTLRSRGHVPDSVYVNALLGMNTKSFDATKYENADAVLDLNRSFAEQSSGGLVGSLDAIYDGGCLDNVFDPAMALKNLTSCLKPGGRILNWACASNWPGAYCMVSPEWLLSFYSLNRFRNVRVYLFQPVSDASKWPNLTANVYRYSPHFTRSLDWDPWAATQQAPGHPAFVIAVADTSSALPPNDWEVPMQSHYLGGDMKDWRDMYEEVADLPFDFIEGAVGDREVPATPFGSDHYTFKGVLRGF